MSLARSLTIAALALVALPPGARGQAPDSVPAFERTEVMIPMRDGVRLHTLVFTPKGETEPLPLLLTRTPYGIDGSLKRIERSYAELARDGYVFVFQDIRGRFGSEGRFVMNRPLHEPADSAGVDETTDTYDTVEWLVRNVPNTTGKVGVLGISYPGWLAAMAGINPHPAVKAISPQAPMTDTWMGDDFFHQGAFRLTYGFEYGSEMELSRDLSVPPPTGGYDTYDWYLARGPLSSLTRLLAGRSPSWTNFVAHPAYDAVWRARALPTYLRKLSVPTLTVGEWWDQEDFYGALKTYATLEPLDTGHVNELVVGPWNHGGWSVGDGRTLGNVDFGSNAARYFRERIQAPWFAHWLKGRDSLPLTEALVFEGGDDRWRAFDRWPVQRTYDPRGSGWYTWLTEDQRFVDNRPDVLTWRTEPLAEGVTIAGNIAAELFASEILRGRYRTGFDHPAPIRPNAIEAYRIDLHQQSYWFRRGHRIMVQVQSTWFPLYDRNPQTFVRNIFEAHPADFRPATQRIYRSAAHPSRVTLPVLAE